MARYSVVDAQGKIANVIEWDGVTPYDPGEGLQLVPHVAVPTGDWIGDTVPAQIIADNAADLVLPEPVQLEQSPIQKVDDAAVA